MTINITMDSITTRTTYCYSYHRISTKNQLKGGGIKRQLEESAAFCEQQGWMMDTAFKLTDIGKSAYHGKHLDDQAALGGFLNAVDQGQVKRPAVLLVESLDRLSRANIMDALELFIRIMNAGITICTYHDRMIYNKESIQSNFGPLLISITIMCRAHEESEIKSKRIKKSWSQMDDRVREGGVGRERIYPEWIDVSSGKPEVIESKAAMVREIFDLCTSKNLSYADITIAMKERHGDDLKWCITKTRRTIKSVKVLGIYETREKEHIKAFPAIIDENTFYLAQSMVAKRQRTQVGRPSKRTLNFFKTMMFCGDCGRPVRNSGSGNATSYLCYSTQLKSKCGQTSKLMVSKFQPILLYAISLVDKDDMLESASNQQKAKLTKEINARQAELEDKQTRIDNLAELVEAGSRTGIQRVARLEKEVDSVTDQITALQDRLDMLSSPLMAASLEHIDSFHQRFKLDQATKADQEPFIEALRNTVEKIIIHSPEHEGLRTKAVIHLLSGIQITVMVARDYSADISKGKKQIGMLEARK